MLASGPSRPWANITPIQSLVERACEPRHEPNYAVNLELADLVNKKKANSPREAVMETVKYINNRNPQVAMMALSLLETLVQRCGYPLHLQISTKDFLNELVRRFPERPPMIMGPVMGRILELIHEWKNTICVQSKHKEDLVHIRDMHRLLSYKGYRFKTFDATRAMASANPTESLKSPEELEEEDRAAKSAKLQELIRRGTPRDLAAAQELMKALSGAEPEKQPDYRMQTLTELEKVQQKAILLSDMLDNVAEGERVGVDGDAYEQVAGVCKAARPKIQKWVGEAEAQEGERDGVEMMDRLLLINDLINNVLERFEACKAGDWVKAKAVSDALNPNSKANDLISFDAFADDDDNGGLALPADTPTGSASSQPQSQFGTTSSGLPLDLFSSPSPGPGAFNSSFPFTTSSPAPTPQRQDPMAFFNQPMRSQAQQPVQQQQQQQQAPPAFGMPQQPMRPNGQPTQPQQQQQQALKKDAFADLVDLMS